MVETRRSKRESTSTAVSSVQSPKRAKAEQPGRVKAKANTVSLEAAGDDTENRPFFWLFKSEPETRMEKGVDMKFGIDELAKCEKQSSEWDGVRNHEAKNNMRKMKVGEYGFFYHSNCKKVRPGIVGIVEVVKEAYPDFTAWDPKDPHYDPKSSQDAPRWFMVDVKLVRKFPRCVTLDEIKANGELSEMQLVKRGRISVQQVRKSEWDVLVPLADGEPEK